MTVTFHLWTDHRATHREQVIGMFDPDTNAEREDARGHGDGNDALPRPTVRPIRTAYGVTEAQIDRTAYCYEFIMRMAAPGRPTLIREYQHRMAS